jgi:hypothetical protein
VKFKNRDKKDVKCLGLASAKSGGSVVRALRKWFRGMSFVFGWQLLRVFLLDDHVLDGNVLLRSYVYVGGA